MQKLMTTRFPAKCKRCKQTIAAGERAYWLGHKAGIQHVTCNVPAAPVEIEKPVASDSDESIFDYSEIANAFKAFQNDPMAVYRHEKNRDMGNQLVSGWDRSRTPGREPWSGATIDEMNLWLDTGYRVQGMSEVSSLVPSKPRRKLIQGEEGDELLVDLAWSGSDEPFVTWEKRARKPGLSVEVGMVFHAGVNAKLIAEYELWVARALQTLDENGVDMEVNLVVRVNRADSEQGYGAKPKELKIRVRKPGEGSDFGSWSAMFSPGGFRMLGIMGIGMMVDRAGGKIDWGYGSPAPHGKWDVLYDDDTNVLKFGECADGPFPNLAMTEKLVTVLTKLSG